MESRKSVSKIPKSLGRMALVLCDVDKVHHRTKGLHDPRGDGLVTGNKSYENTLDVTVLATRVLPKPGEASLEMSKPKAPLQHGDALVNL